MFKIKWFKLKTTIVSYLAKFIYVFNRHVKGIKIKYNLHYAGDKKQYHTLDVIYPKAAKNLPCVLYLHGGGWTAYDKRMFRSTCKQLSKAGTVVFNCNFSLAPKFNINDMLKDIEYIFSFIKSNAGFFGGNADKIILAGDSAGAHLHSMFVNKSIIDKKEEYTSIVKACAFFYGAYDLTTIKSSGFERIYIYLDALVKPGTPDYSEVLKSLSPINLVTKDHPKTLICSGEVDSLHQTQSAKYIEKLKENGVEVKSVVFPKDYKMAKHRFITFVKNKAAIKSFAAFKEFIQDI